MRRIAAIATMVLAAAALLVVAPGAAEEDGYEVRAIFDSAGFLVPGEEVRVAGARVGTVADVEVAMPGDQVHADGSDDPGKAVVVLRIDDPGFQDFRRDASCLIQTQSLIGEQYVECEPTQPRAPGTEPPPELEAVPEGERGAGQRLLPVERNGKTVDLDLVNNIMREPYPDRFRLILNDLGAGLAARGDELAEIVERSNPALRETNRVLAILARQNRSLASLASDSDAILTALARERESVAGFINEAATVGEATAARRAELEETFARFPGFLRELRATMAELRAFSDQATPVFGDLRGAAPSLNRAAHALEPFSRAGTRALTSLGDAAEEAGPPLRAADPVVRQTRNLARGGAPTMRNLALTLSTLRRTDGFQHLLETIFGLGGTVNAFDEFGHFARAVIPVQICFDYTSIPQAGCSARFGTFTGGLLRAAARALKSQDDPARERRGTAEPSAPEAPDELLVPGDGGSQEPAPAVPEPQEPAPEPLPEPEPDGESSPQTEGTATTTSARMGAMRQLLDFLIGTPGERGVAR